MHLPDIKKIITGKPIARPSQLLDPPAERPIQLACLLVVLIAVAIYAFAMRPWTSLLADGATPSPADATSLENLLARCRTGRDSAWSRECERRTRAEDEKSKGNSR
jgi:hypothetical protein